MVAKLEYDISRTVSSPRTRVNKDRVQSLKTEVR
jgi:hypothetical protein